MNKCGYCGNEYEAKTARSRYCSDTCRAMACKVAQPDFAQPSVAQPEGIVAQPDLDDPQYLKDIIEGRNNPNTTQPVVLSDGQTFYPDPRPQQVLDHWSTGRQGAYKQILAGISEEYEVCQC